MVFVVHNRTFLSLHLLGMLSAVWGRVLEVLLEGFLELLPELLFLVLGERLLVGSGGDRGRS